MSINVDPSNIKTVLKPGETKNGEIIVQNLGSGPIRIKAYTEDWVCAEDGSKNFMKPGSSVYSCSGWIMLEPASFELAPMEEQKVKYSITAPKNASGSHVSVIFFESVMQTREGIAISGRIGTIVYQDTEGDIKRSGELKGISVLASKEGDPVNIKLSFSNNGNSFLSARPKVAIFRDNDLITEAQMKPINTLPGDLRTGDISLQTPLKEGRYKARIEVTYDDKTLKADTDFSINK